MSTTDLAYDLEQTRQWAIQAEKELQEAKTIAIQVKKELEDERAVALHWYTLYQETLTDLTNTIEALKQENALLYGN